MQDERPDPGARLSGQHERPDPEVPRRSTLTSAFSRSITVLGMRAIGCLRKNLLARSYTVIVYSIKPIAESVLAWVPSPDEAPMSKRKTDVIENFGERLAQLRKAAGYTQVEFAAEVGITQRMVAYYEAPNAQPPAHLLPQMAQVLGVGADVLLGMAQERKVKRLATNSLERRLLAIEKLDPKAKRQITQLLDTFIEREKLKQRVNAQGA